jgi:phosphoglycolate phosphatase
MDHNHQRNINTPVLLPLKYDLVAFDFDGTLADTFPWFTDVLDSLADRFNFHHPTADEKSAMRDLEAHDVLKLLGVPLWKAPLIVAYARRKMFEDNAGLRLFDGIEQALAQIDANGTKLAVVSSNSLENVRRTLGPEAAALIDIFECGIDIFGKSAKLKRLVKRTCRSPGRAIFIGDELRDIDAARATGVEAGAVGWGYNRAAALIAHRPDQFFESVADMLAYFTLRLPTFHE